MARLTFEGVTFELEPGRSVLDGLLGRGIDAPYSCRAGTCQSCLMRAITGKPPAKSQAGLKETLKDRGYFLPCVCVPDGDLECTKPQDPGLVTSTVVHETHRVSGDVTRLRLIPDSPLDYRAGQFVNLIRADGLTRSYSLASVSGHDRHLELHIRHVPGGQMSGWVAMALREGDRVMVRGPAGECFYVPGRPEQPLLLAGTGTGLAPLYGIARDAIRSGHRGPMHLIHGALTTQGHYLVEELIALSRDNPQFAYSRCAMRGLPEPGVKVGDLQEFLVARHPDLKGTRVFLCGDPAIVLSLKKKAFLAGANMKDIHADAFVMATAATP